MYELNGIFKKCNISFLITDVMQVRMLADTTAAFTKAVDMDLDLTAVLGSVRSKRYAMLVENGIVKAVDIEPDNTGLTCSIADNFIKNL